jgi:hypothetical protein
MRTPQNLWILCISSCVEYVVSTSNRPIRRAVSRFADHDAVAVDERDAKVRAGSRLFVLGYFVWTNDDVTARRMPTDDAKRYEQFGTMGRWREVKAQAWTHISLVRERSTMRTLRMAERTQHSRIISFFYFFAFARASKRFDEPIERCTWHERYPRRWWQRLRICIGACRSVGVFVRPPSCVPLAALARTKTSTKEAKEKRRQKVAVNLSVTHSL